MADDQFIKILSDRSYFFDAGLKFSCQQCGACCTGEPGVIFVKDDEISPIADFLEFSREIFVERCLYPYADSYSIREAEDGRCIFYESGCSIYPVRPLQCRTYPFWFHAMRSEHMWKDITRNCPGVGQGHLYAKDEILQICAASFYLYEAIKDDMP